MNKISSISSFNKLLFVGLLAWVTLLVSNAIFERYIIFEIKTRFPAKFRHAQQHTPGDLAVFGPSYTQNGIDPSSFNERIYNYSLIGAGYVINSEIMKAFFKHDSCSPVIIAFYPRFLYHPGIGDQKYYLPFIEEQFIRDIKEIEFKLYEKSKALKYFSRYPDFCKEYFRERISNTERFSKGSLLNFGLSLQDSSASSYGKGETREWLFPDQIESFFELLQTQEQRHIFLVRTPVTPESNYRDDPKDIEKIQNAIDSLPNVTFLDYKDMVLPYSYFMDKSHLNGAGAKYFSDILAREISTILKTPY